MVGILDSIKIVRNDELEKNIDIVNNKKYTNKIINFVGNNH